MKKILIIEDDQIVANVYRNKLAVEGYQAEVAADGESGLKVMRTFQPNLIILDLMLPTISGVEVIKEIRKEPDFAKIPISSRTRGARARTNVFPSPVARRRILLTSSGTPSATAAPFRRPFPPPPIRPRENRPA
jgi:CheY-like chemotaxis protein